MTSILEPTKSVGISCKSNLGPLLGAIAFPWRPRAIRHSRARALAVDYPKQAWATAMGFWLTGGALGSCARTVSGEIDNPVRGRSRANAPKAEGHGISGGSPGRGRPEQTVPAQNRRREGKTGSSYSRSPRRRPNRLLRKSKPGRELAEPRAAGHRSITGRFPREFERRARLG